MLRTFRNSRALRGLLPLGFALALLSLMIDAALHVARADIVGWHIEARACQGPVRCVDLTPSSKLWPGLYACQTRAERLKDGAADIPPDAIGLPPGQFTFSVRCKPVEGLPDA